MLMRLLRGVFGGRSELQRVFTRVYRENVWRGDESRSGKGSGRRHTETLVRELPGLLERLGARSLLDAPCGDFAWMQEVPLAGKTYFGVDIVEELIKENRARFESGSRRFIRADITRDKLPRADLVLCRDCLVHLTLGQAKAAIENFRRSGATYLAVTTFPDTAVNMELPAHPGWRALNMRLAPFNLSEPVELINECYAGDGGRFADKSVGVWRLQSS